MCSESLWWRCHRRLISDVLVLLHDVEVQHLGHDARRTPHAPAEGARVSADGLRYDRPVEGSLLAFRGAREATLPLLRLLTEDEWDRTGTHTESGRYSVADWLRVYGPHAHEHADQIRRARAAR